MEAGKDAGTGSLGTLGRPWNAWNARASLATHRCMVQPAEPHAPVSHTLRAQQMAKKMETGDPVRMLRDLTAISKSICV